MCECADVLSGFSKGFDFDERVAGEGEASRTPIARRQGVRMGGTVRRLGGDSF